MPRTSSYLRLYRRESQERRKWQQYDAMKRVFLDKTPDATPQEIQRAFREFSDKLGL